MPIDLRCLRAAVAVRDLEIEACNSMLAAGVFERRAAIHRRQDTRVIGGKLCLVLCAAGLLLLG
jgi:hypothetical protein